MLGVSQTAGVRRGLRKVGHRPWRLTRAISWCRRRLAAIPVPHRSVGGVTLLQTSELGVDTMKTF